MRSIKLVLHSAALALFLAGAMAQAAQIRGTVSNKTTGKPAAGDTVELIDVQSGMTPVSQATTDASGRYSLNSPDNTPHLIRVTHQGAAYFIAAPQGNQPGDVSVYDVASKVDGVFIEADVIEFEADSGGELRVTERYFVHNTSNPPRTEWSPKTFSIVLPPDANIVGTAAQRPAGLPTSVKLDPDGAKGHYSFNFPIQPDQGDKDTLFQIQYTVPYTNNTYTFHTQVSLPTQNVGVLLPMSMSFQADQGSVFQSVKEDPNVQTFVARNAVPGKVLTYTVSGTGSMPREQQADNGSQAAQNTGQPGGGLGAPIGSPDPLSKYKWWILSALGLLLVVAAAFLLRKPADSAVAASAAPQPSGPAAAPAASARTAPAPVTGKSALLSALKDELFAIESEKLDGTLKPAEYAEVKAALEVVLKRALSKK